MLAQRGTLAARSANHPDEGLLFDYAVVEPRASR
jgi:hypothetical protein